MEGAQTTHNSASDSMKDATTLSSTAGNGHSEHNPHSYFENETLCHWAPSLPSTNRIMNTEY